MGPVCFRDFYGAVFRTQVNVNNLIAKTNSPQTIIQEVGFIQADNDRRNFKLSAALSLGPLSRAFTDNLPGVRAAAPTNTFRRNQMKTCLVREPR